MLCRHYSQRRSAGLSDDSFDDAPQDFCKSGCPRHSVGTEARLLITGRSVGMFWHGDAGHLYPSVSFSIAAPQHRRPLVHDSEPCIVSCELRHPLPEWPAHQNIGSDFEKLRPEVVLVTHAIATRVVCASGIRLGIMSLDVVRLSSVSSSRPDQRGGSHAPHTRDRMVCISKYPTPPRHGLLTSRSERSVVARTTWPLHVPSPLQDPRRCLERAAAGHDPMSIKNSGYQSSCRWPYVSFHQIVSLRLMIVLASGRIASA
jgi:hypothetical protein